MRVVQKKLENESAKLYYEQFENYQEFLKTVESRDRDNSHGEHSLKKNSNRGKDWTGVKNYEEARNLLINGWDAKVEYLKEQFKQASKELDEKRVVKTFSDMVGFMPIVPNVIIGLPNCMLNNRTETKKSKVIKFLIDTTASCGEDSNDMIKYYSEVLARIALLERKGYRCRIEILQCYTDESNSRTKACFSVLIKNENQPFDIKRMAFPMAHTAMFRVFGFAWENSLPINYDSYHCGGLGTPMYHWRSNRRENLINGLRNVNEKIVYVSYKKDLNQIFEREVVE